MKTVPGKNAGEISFEPPLLGIWGFVAAKLSINSPSTMCVHGSHLMWRSRRPKRDGEAAASALSGHPGYIIIIHQSDISIRFSNNAGSQRPSEHIV
jgi:hypothetical protein